jgi:trk system potassium uptake protein TrkH
MHFSAVARVLGLMLMLFSISLLVPIPVASYYGEHTQGAFFLAFAITFSLGMLIWLPYSRTAADMRTRDGFVITVLFWLVLGLMGAIPLMLAEPLRLDVAGAAFEAISGLTTTGATVITGLDALPKSILYYRQQLHWLGGIGIVVIAVAIMPMLGIGGMQLYRAETPGPVKDAKLTPRITETAKALFFIYLVLTLACILAYWIAGMSPFDAIGHAFSTVSTGGFTIVFMILAGLNFGLHFLVWNRRTPWQYLRDPEARLFLVLLVTGSLVVGLYLFATATYDSPGSLLHGSFQFVSIMTSTGYGTADFSQWPSFLPVFLVVSSFFGGCGGSTSGGVKIGRMLIMAKQCLNEFYRLIHPNAVRPLKLGDRAVGVRVADAIWAFFGVYLAVFYGITLLLLASGLDFETAWSATAACLNNMGPGLGEVAANFGGISDFAKWVLCAAMLLGRLEIFTMLVLLSPAFWRR